MALAIERWFECQILSRKVFESPILDLGCGDGIFASTLFAEPLDLGIDADPLEVGKAARRECYREVLACPGQAIPKPDGHYRTIFSNSVLEHIEDIEPVLQEARRLLHLEGRFYVTVPSYYFDRYSVGFRLLEGSGLGKLAERYRQFYDRFWKHYHYYRPQAWRELFERNGFHVVGHQEYCPRWNCSLDDLLVPLAFFSLVCKKLLGRWFLFPRLRRLWAPFLSRLVEPWLVLDPDLKDGGLLFFALARSPGKQAG